MRSLRRPRTLAARAGCHAAGGELIRRFFLAGGLRRLVPLLILHAGVAFAAAPSAAGASGEGGSQPWEADAGLQAMARLQPGLQRNHVALYFDGELTDRGLGLPGQEAMEGTFADQTSLTLTFRLPALAEPLHLTCPFEGSGFTPWAPGAWPGPNSHELRIYRDSFALTASMSRHSAAGFSSGFAPPRGIPFRPSGAPFGKFPPKILAVLLNETPSC